MTNVTPVIFCGGSGTSLWPLSRAGFSKQFLSLTVNESLSKLDITYTQASPPLVVTCEYPPFLAAEQLRETRVELGFALLEPLGRNTSSALTLAALQGCEDFILGLSLRAKRSNL